MKLYLTKALVYALLLLALLFVGDYAVTKGLKKTGYKEFTKMSHVFTGSVKADVLIMGGSDAVQHISPSIIDSFLNLNSYNLGVTGHNFFMQYAFFDNYLKNNGSVYPKIIIQVVNSDLLSRRKDLYNYQLFLPYLSNPQITQYTKAYEGLKWADYNLPFIKYSGELDILKIGLYEFLGYNHYPSIFYKGYCGIDRPWDESELTVLKKNYPNSFVIHKESIDLFEKYLKQLKERGIKVFLVQCPSYSEFQELFVNRDSITTIFKKFATQYQIPFYDYSKSSLSYNKTNFNDCVHLNSPYAEIFAREVAERIKQDLNNHPIR
jgi:hypothetical protein